MMRHEKSLRVSKMVVFRKQKTICGRMVDSTDDNPEYAE